MLVLVFLMQLITVMPNPPKGMSAYLVEYPGVTQAVMASPARTLTYASDLRCTGLAEASGLVFRGTVGASVDKVGRVKLDRVIWPNSKGLDKAVDMAVAQLRFDPGPTSQLRVIVKFDCR